MLKLLDQINKMEEEQVVIQRVPYFRNYLGLNVTEESMKSVPHAKVCVYIDSSIHIAPFRN